MEDKYSKFVSQVKTKDERDLMAHEIDMLISSLYKSGEDDFENVLEKSVRSSIALEIKSVITGDNKEKALKELKNLLSEKEVLTLTLAFDPNSKVVTKVAAWAQKNVSNSVVLDIKIDKRIIAGAVISYNGKYKDASVIKGLEEVLQRSNQKLTDLLSVSGEK